MPSLLIESTDDSGQFFLISVLAYGLWLMAYRSWDIGSFHHWIIRSSLCFSFRFAIVYF